MRRILGLNLQVSLNSAIQLIKSQRRRLIVLFPSPRSYTFGSHECATEVRLVREATLQCNVRN